MIRSLVLGGVAAAAIIAVAAGASMAGDDRGRSVASDQCVSRPLDTTKVIDDKTLYMDDRHGHAVLLHMSGSCMNDSNEAIQLEYTGGSTRICSPMDVEVTGNAVTTQTRCFISSVEALTPEQAAAYRARR